MKKIILGLLIAFALQACSEKLNVTRVANTKWVLSEWPGQTLPTVANATLNFDADGKIGGKSFCNGYGGNTTFTANGLKFSEIFGTKMYCEAVGDAENKYTADLAEVNAAKISQDKLHLLKDGKVLMVFTRSM